ncbi:elongation of very long chain fatty acids protein 1-like protein [Lasius niger]|uniref:Elongation of very long chain fatty acids protein n=1 Tax=Lasius niger TaxID=67767 RepID=A0A0J7KJT4_LASNI|nr:elongation of very long chain fatty acids protein 1-like protein [Lasius niger]
MEIMDIYYYLIDEISDPRVSDWLFMSNPFGVALISLVYLSFVLYFGPRYMKDRKPYVLTKTMICYNISVATANLVIFYGILTSGYTTHLSMGCEPFAISNDPMSLSIQFAIMVAHTFQALLPSCEPTRKPLAYIYMSQIAIMFYMFLDYYRKSYLRKKIE